MKETIETPNFILLNVGYSDLNADWNWKGVYSPFARIYYVKKGRAKKHIKGKTYILEPDRLYLTPPFTSHDDECDSLFSLYYIHFYEKVNNQESIFEKYNFPIEVKADRLDIQLVERLLSINPDRHLRHFDPELYDNMPTFSQYLAESNKMPIHSIIETQGILQQLISKFFRQANLKSATLDSRLSKTLEYIHENIDKEISIKELAEIACISEDHYIRIFKKEVKNTPLKYINTKKIEKAQFLLLTTDTPIMDIALELSIDNLSYFSRLFKQYVGKTPSEYREVHSR